MSAKRKEPDSNKPLAAEFVLAEVDEFDRELARVRRNKKLMALLDRRSRQKEKLSLAQVRQNLGL